MSAGYELLLNATIDHLKDLKEHGVRFVNVSPKTLTALGQAPRTLIPPVLNAPAPDTSASSRTFGSDGIFGGSAAASAAAAQPQARSTGLADPAKKEAMRELKERALVCVKCGHLAKSRKNVVFGVGDPNAELMFVGEAPGADEDDQGEPFVGAAGQLLTRIIQTMGLDRDRVYIANILKCRPDTPGQPSGNRKPTPDEMRTCIPYLHSQIDILQPKVLVALGATAIEGLIGKTVGITKLRGTWQTYRDTPLMPTFHPAYLLRNQALSEKRKVWEDMLQVMKKLGMPISDKQRAYFLKA